MILYICILLALYFIPFRYAKDGIHSEYISKQSSDCVKGFFILCIISMHFMGWNYVPGPVLDDAFQFFNSHLHQFCVSMFLFYSGFGLMESYEKKGFSYVENLPRARILKVFLLYLAAEVIFLLFNRCAGIVYDRKTVLYSLAVWRSIGIDNWYFFDILMLYTISWGVFRMYRGERLKIASAITVLSIICALLLRHLGKEYWWYDTILCYSFGVWFSLLRGKIEQFFSDNRHYFVTLSVLVGTALLYNHFFRWKGSIPYNLSAVFFVATIVMVSMKIPSDNPVLAYAGRHITGIFLMHRLPMILFTRYLVIPNLYLRFAAVLFSSILLGRVFEKITSPLDKVLQPHRS